MAHFHDAHKRSPTVPGWRPGLAQWTEYHNMSNEETGPQMAWSVHSGHHLAKHLQAQATLILLPN